MENLSSEAPISLYERTISVAGILRNLGKLPSKVEGVGTVANSCALEPLEL